VTYPRGSRKGAPKTIRLEDQQLPDREVAFYTPRAGDWLLLAVLVAALLGIGARVWSQLGWSDPGGQAIFFGLLLLAIFWTALIYTFKLSLAIRVGPQGLAIVRGPWRVELRWSEITRLMERPQMISGRRYRWVVALARDGRRIQVREDALLDYERFRREVYERYRLWRDHGGTWGATGGGPFVAKEVVAEGTGWWALAALLVALSGLYLALLLPSIRLAGYALMALALLCLAMVVSSFLRRRTYALDGRMIEARGLLDRVQLAWRDVAKVERTRHPAGGVILAAVAVGRFALRLAARGDAGIRGFAWSPRVPEYLTLRGGGRHARIRLHHLAQPEELVAWIDFYTGLRRASPSRPLEPVAPEAPRRAGVTSGPVETAVAAAITEDMDEERAPDLSGVSGPLDPWGGNRRGEPAASAPRGGSAPLHEPLPEPLFRGAPLSASFREPDGLDLPPDAVAAADGIEQNDEAWLRETSALFSMSAGAPTSPAPKVPEEPRGVDHIADAQTMAAPVAPTLAAPRARQFVPPPVPPRAPRAAPTGAPPSPPTEAPRHTPTGAPPSPPHSTPTSAPRPAPFAPPFASRPTQQPRMESPFAPYNPNIPDEAPIEETPVVAEEDAPTEAIPVIPAISATLAPTAPSQWDTPPASPESIPARPPENADQGASDIEERSADGEDGEDGEDGLDEPAPWRSPDWQPPVLPRFGPQSAQPAEEFPPRRDGRQTDH
jgi:hypothetical protein